MNKAYDIQEQMNNVNRDMEILWNETLEIKNTVLEMKNAFSGQWVD